MATLAFLLQRFGCGRALWGVLLWLAAMVVVVPLAGQPFFFGFGMPMVAALVAHIVYGVILAAIVGRPE